MSVLSTAAQKQVEKRLIDNGLVGSADLESIRDQSEKANKPFIETLVESGKVTNEQLTKIIASVTKVPYVNLTDVQIDEKILSLLPKELAERYMAVPLGEMQHRLVVGMLDASNVQAVDFLSNKIGRPLKVYAASETGIRNIIKQYDSVDLSKEFENVAQSIQQVNEVAQKTNEKRATKKAEDSNQKDRIRVITQDSPISKALTSIIDHAAKQRASDIHFEPLENEFRIRCRIDGVLREIMKLPKSMEPPMVSRIKILSNLKIDEHRIPQDGQFTAQADGRLIDMRVAISPVIWGEQVILRLLDKSGTSLMLEDLGYKGRALREVREGLKSSNGMVLTSGPTGSGKSTSMYAMIQEIKTDGINIVTLEDPVEYKIEGVNQIQVNADVGLTFATGLRSILRQDPDVVMVGEIRDKETAQLAVQAALTGHLVFSTLHTNSASGILPRLLDMGIEPFLIASTVRTVIGQRLVRRIGESGKQNRQSDSAETESIHTVLGRLLPESEAEMPKIANELGYENLPLKGQNAYTLFEGTDSPSSPGGYAGRMGLYEAFPITDAIKELIMKRSTSADIQKVAEAEGMISMREDGYLKVLAGYTTLAEVDRVAAADST